MSASKPRGKNWTQLEDEVLCKAWLEVSQDPAVGTYQKTEKLYARIFEKFVEICTMDGVPNSELRAPSGIKSRWHTINKCASKFAGCLAQINARPQCGASPEDNLKKALALYATKEKAPFTLISCYRLMESAPKWQQYHVKGPAVKRSGDHISNDDVEEEDADASCSKTIRPRGRDATKTRKITDSATLELAKSGRLLAAAAGAKVEDGFKRTKALTRIANHAIMSVDFSGLNSVAKRYYELEQHRILEETLKEVAPAPENPMIADKRKIQFLNGQLKFYFQSNHMKKKLKDWKLSTSASTRRKEK
ncbi:uncharacterized protein LOC134221629 [Armigeres subalbatus]|uniref:uncharacterized protein LOC134221629 n=1 Tax=Armigeres subalbatus TaxID=124917 RepID=UPI002ED1D28E